MIVKTIKVNFFSRKGKKILINEPKLIYTKDDVLNFELKKGTTFIIDAGISGVVADPIYYEGLSYCTVVNINSFYVEDRGVFPIERVMERKGWKKVS